MAPLPRSDAMLASAGDLSKPIRGCVRGKGTLPIDWNESQNVETDFFAHTLIVSVRFVSLSISRSPSSLAFFLSLSLLLLGWVPTAGFDGVREVLPEA